MNWGITGSNTATGSKTLPPMTGGTVLFSASTSANQFATKKWKPNDRLQSLMRHRKKTMQPNIKRIASAQLPRAVDFGIAINRHGMN